MQNLASFIEYENGNKQNTHVFMRMQMDNGKIEEIDLFANDKVRKYKTRLDDSIREAGKGCLIGKYHSTQGIVKIITNTNQTKMKVTFLNTIYKVA